MLPTLKILPIDAALAEGWLLREFNWHYAISPEVQDKFEPEIRDLLGHTGDNPPHFNGPTDFSGPVYSQPYLGAAEGMDDFDDVSLFRPKQQ